MITRRPSLTMIALGLIIGCLVATAAGVVTAAPAPRPTTVQLSAAQTPPHGAGLVVRHGDGRQVIAYVSFNEPRLSGLELLQRAGLKIVTAPAGFGQAVCSINGEGCPADNCFCQSYGNPARYWRYYLRSQGRWVYAAMGPSSRALQDGDIDGWEWSGEPPRLPDLTIEAIAARAGGTRPARLATATMTASPTAPIPTTAPPGPVSASPTPPAIVTAPVAATPVLAPPRPATATSPPASPVRPPTIAPSATSLPPTATRAAAAAAMTAEPAAPPTPGATRPTGDGRPASPTLLLTPTVAPAVVAPAPAPSPTSAPAPTSPSQPTAVASAQTVVIAADGQTSALPTRAEAPVPWLGYGAVGAIGLGLLAYLLVNRYRRATSEDER